MQSIGHCDYKTYTEKMQRARGPQPLQKTQVLASSTHKTGGWEGSRVRCSLSKLKILFIFQESRLITRLSSSLLDTLLTELRGTSQCVLYDYLFVLYITPSMEQSPSSEANRFSASHEFPHIWKRQFHYHIYKCPLPVSIPSQINPVHASPFHFLKIHLV